MSKIDITNEFLHKQADYLDILNILNLLKQDVKNGLMTEETLKEVVKQLEPIKNDYEWWAYVEYLQNKPTKKSKRVKYEKEYKYLYDAMFADRVKASEADNVNALKYIKDLYIKLKNKEEE